MPNYNGEKFLEPAIESILNQEYPNLELMILDGGSTDKSVEIIERYAGRIAYWRTGPDDGHYASINEGLKRATGEVYAWLNSDDFYVPGSLYQIGDVFSACPDVQWMISITPGSMNKTGDLQFTKQSGCSFESLYAGRHLPIAGRRNFGFVQQESTFFRDQIWKNVGGLRPEVGLAADFALWLDFARIAVPHVTRYSIGAWRRHESNLSGDLSAYFTSAEKVLRVSREHVGWRPNPFTELFADLPFLARGPIRERCGYVAHGVRRRDDIQGCSWERYTFRYL